MEKENKKSKLFWWIVCSFLLVPLITSIVSTIHVINFFELSNYKFLAITLAIAFELGALASLAGLIALNKINKNVVYFIFILLTIYQICGNVYYAYDFISRKMIESPNLIKNWAELFGLGEDDGIMIKRIIAIISGAVLPIISLSFLDLSVDYIQKSNIKSLPIVEPQEKTITVPTPVTIDLKIDGEEIKKEMMAAAVSTPEHIEPEKIIEEPKPPVIIEPTKEDILKVDNEDHEDFAVFMEQKKQHVNKMREPNLKLLDLFYDGGTIKKDNELPSFNDFIKKINMEEYSQKEINFFLTLCNYLDIFILSGTQKIALKDYEEAKEILGNYLSW